MRDDVVNEGSVCDGGVGKLLAGDGGADDGEDARTDDRADAERGERPGPERLLQRMLRLLGVADELVNRLSGEELAGQSRSPCSEQWSVISGQRAKGVEKSKTTPR